MSTEQVSSERLLHVCPDCRNQFGQPFVCTTCGAQKLYDHTVTTQAETIQRLTRQLDEAASLVNDYYWVESKGTGREVDKRAGRFLKRMGKL
jgi:hypothetical protein